MCACESVRHGLVEVHVSTCLPPCARARCVHSLSCEPERWGLSKECRLGLRRLSSTPWTGREQIYKNVGFLSHAWRWAWSRTAQCPIPNIEGQEPTERVGGIWPLLPRTPGELKHPRSSYCSEFGGRADHETPEDDAIVWHQAVRRPGCMHVGRAVSFCQTTA